MSDKPLSVASLEESINGWPQEFKDFVDGRDVVTWANLAFQVFGPALAIGQEHPRAGVTLGPRIPPEERVVWSFPAFFDDDPAAASQAGGRTKFQGKARQGLAAFTETRFAWSHALNGPLCMVYDVPLNRVTGLNPLTFKVSLLSMSAAGAGFEVLYTEPGEGQQRLVFRVALTPMSDRAFESKLGAHVSGPK